MAVKTISLELSAYEKLRRAKRQPRESFSSVVQRARWDDLPPNAGRLLEDLQVLCRRHPETILNSASLDALECRTRTARRKSPWAR